MAEPDWTIPADGRTMWERFCASEPHIAALEPRIEESCRRAGRLAARFNELWLDEPERAQQTLRELLGGLGEGVTVRGPITVDHGRFITIFE